MDALKMKRPPLPRELYRPTVLGFLLYCIHTYSWFIVFGWLSMAILATTLPMWLKVTLLIPSIICTGHGFHMIGWFSHDGMHLSMFRNKYWSVLAGIFFGGTALFPTIGYAITHWNHHRYTNQDSDPDAKIYPQYTTFWSRFFWSRITANRGYFRNTVRLALGRPLDKGYRMPFKDGWTQAFAICTLVSIALWLGLFIIIGFISPTYLLVGIVLPYLTAIPATGLRIYMEHCGTGAGIFRDSRSYTSPVWTAIMFGNNYHLEHHLYPTVPAYHLPRVHRLLKEQGVYDISDTNIVPGVFAPLRFLSAKHQYPSSLLTDLQADPFIPSHVDTKT